MVLLSGEGEGEGVEASEEEDEEEEAEEEEEDAALASVWRRPVRPCRRRGNVRLDDNMTSVREVDRTTLVRDTDSQPHSGRVKKE